MTFFEYITGLVSAAAAFALIEIMLPGEGSGIRRLTSFALSLAMCCAVLSPGVRLIGQIGEKFMAGDYSAVFTENYGLDALYSALSEESAAEIEAVLTDKICAEFSIPEDRIRVRVKVSADSSGVRIESVTAELSGTGILTDPHLLADFTEKLCGVRCETATR